MNITLTVDDSIISQLLAEAKEKGMNIENYFLRNLLSLYKSIVMEARKLDWNDTEDCIQFCTAKAWNADYTVTRNIKDFTQSTIEVITPE